LQVEVKSQDSYLSGILKRIDKLCRLLACCETKMGTGSVQKQGEEAFGAVGRTSKKHGLRKTQNFMAKVKDDGVVRGGGDKGKAGWML